MSHYLFVHTSHTMTKGAWSRKTHTSTFLSDNRLIVVEAFVATGADFTYIGYLQVTYYTCIHYTRYPQLVALETALIDANRMYFHNRVYYFIHRYSEERHAPVSFCQIHGFMCPVRTHFRD